MDPITITTYSGLQFDVRRAGPDDGPLLAEFWRHVSRENLATRYIGTDDPTHPDHANSGPGGQSDRTTTLLAFGGDGGVIAIASLIAEPDGGEARIMEFTRDRITAHGISWALLEQLLLCAQESGISAVTSVFSVEDVRAIELERQMGFVETDYPGDDRLRILRWTFDDLAEPAARARPVR